MFKPIALAAAVALIVFASAAQAVSKSLDVSPPTVTTSIVDTAKYRSTGSRQKIQIDRAHLAQIKNVSASRRLDYGAFSVLEVDSADAARLIDAGIASNADGNNRAAQHRRD